MKRRRSLGWGGRLLALLAAALLALTSSGLGSALAQQGGGTITFTGLNPPPDSVVPAGETIIAATVNSTGTVGRVAMVLNSQPLSFERGGPSASVAAIFTGRILAPGLYTVNVVAEDSTGDRRSVTWRFTVRQTDPIPDNFMQVDAKIQIVFPHNNAPVTEANLANIGAFLFTPGTTIPVPCAFDRTVRLWRALNNNPAEPIAVGTKVIRNVAGRTFPAWEFNNVDVSAARNPNNKLFFFVTVGDQPSGTNSNVWVHGADPRTIFPFQDVPSAVLPWPTDPAQLDAKIEIVFPHNNLPVRQATLANIGTDIFRRGTLQSVDFSRNPFVHLIRSLNADVATYGATNDQRITATTGGVAHPRWVHNDVDVSAATTGTPPNLILFRSLIDDPFISTFPTVWAHGADVRTFFPIQDVPSQSCQGPIR